MVDSVNINNIDENVARRIDWAKDSTLNRLVGLSDEQVGLLEKIAGTSRRSQLDTRNTQTQVNNLADATEDAAKATKQYGEALDKNEEKLRDIQNKASERARKQYLRESVDRDNVSRSVGDLRNSMNNLSRTASSPSSAFEALTDKMAVFGGRLSEKTGALKGAGTAVTMFSRALTAASFAFGVLSGISDPYRKMVDSGLLFEGSAVRFARSAYDSGLNLEQFSRIAGQYSQTVSAVGDQAYSQSIKRFRDSSQQFGYYGMNMEELADAQTRYMNEMRISGTLFNMSAQEQDQATENYLKNLTAVSVLTGRQRRSLEEEQAKATRRAQIALTIERIRRTEGDVAADAIKAQYGELVNLRGQTVADVAFAGQFNLGGPTREEARELGPSGLLESAMSAVNFRDPESVRRFSERNAQAVSRIPTDLLGNLAIGARFGGGASEAARALGEGEDNLFTRARTTLAGPQAEPRAAQADAARRGQIIDRLTERTLTAQVRTAEAMNSLKSAALGAAEQLGVLRAVAEAAAAAASVASGGAGFLSGATNTLGGSAAVLGVLGGGAAIGLIVKSMLTGAAVRSIGTMIAPALPAMSSVFGKAAGAVAGGAGSVLSGAGSLLRGLGIAGGVAGTGIGMYQAAAGDTRSDRVTGIGGAALSGAATGAMLGSIVPGIGTGVGAGIGALVGGGGALLANLLTAQATAPNATLTAAPMLTEARTGIQPSQMDAYWGSGSPIINLLTTIAENTRQGARASLSVATNTA
jgi:hypothetical protein